MGTSTSVIAGLWFIAVAVALLLWILFQQVSATLESQDSLRDRLQTAKLRVQEHAQNLAHDFRNKALALRTLKTAITPRLAAGELQRIITIASDIDEHAEHLSLRLADEALGSPGDSPLASSTYLRGVINNVLKTHSPAMNGPTSQSRLRVFGSPEPFVKVPSGELTRILGNLITNAAEACSDSPAPRIDVEVRLDETWATVVVSDNGPGVPDVERRNIFEAGVSTKGRGRGNGLSNALERAQKYGGTLEVLPQVHGSGASFELRIPLARTPDWFVDRIILRDGARLVVVDDEDEASALWQKALDELFERIKVDESVRPSLVVLRSPQELRHYPELLETRTIFLVDQFFANETTTGIDLINELGIATRAILVTNHFENNAVVSQALRAGVKILPKTYVLQTRFPLDFGGQREDHPDR